MTDSTEPRGRTLGTLLADARALERRSEHHRALLWSRWVNRPLGALIALLLLDTRATPNMVSVTGFATHVAGSAIVLLSPAPARPLVVVIVFVLWQLGHAFDCADGQLARARGTASPFGAWLDQILDYLGHTADLGSLAVFVARAYQPDPALSVALGILLVTGILLGLFAPAQRNALLGTAPAVDPRGRGSGLRLLLLGRHLTDYPVLLAVWSVGLAWPPLLVASLGLAWALICGAVAAQVAINWRSSGRPGQR